MSSTAQPNVTDTYNSETAYSLAAAAAALGTLFTEREKTNPDGAAADWRESHGSMSLYDGLTQLAFSTERVWQTAPLALQEHVVWDFEFLEVALDRWLAERGPVMKQDDRWVSIEQGLNAYLTERQDDA